MDNSKKEPTITDKCGTHTGHYRHYVNKEKPCDPCRLAFNAYARERYAKQPGKRNRKPQNNLSWRYKISIEEYQEMLQAQNWVCAICKQPERTIIRGKLISLAVDHDHSCCPNRKSCGKCVRGILCKSCNLLIAQLENNNLLRAINEYLSKTG